MTENEQGPDLAWALAFYSAAGAAGYYLVPNGGWLVALGGVFLVRGALDIPLFRDDQLNTTKMNPKEYRENRLQSLDSRIVRLALDFTGKVVGAVLVVALIGGILMQLPGSCSRNVPDGEQEYRQL